MMRLINTQTLTLHDFTGSNTPKYAILSHRWTDEELSFKEFSKGRSKDKKGYRKIVEFCEFLRRWGREWCWVDTVCIDKRSSAELSEAINSMFEWYKKATECWVWLHDVSNGSDTGSPITPEDLFQQFSQSSWFKRGWTLQELLAPLQVVFCSREWQILGCKYLEYNRFSKLATLGVDAELWDRLQEAAMWTSEIVLWATTDRTGIPSEVLLNPGMVQRFSIAQRMSWASDRQTTRVEDEAYCLLGLFKVNMPLLYGEGRRAFQRLQQEIIRSSHDESIYAWSTETTPEQSAWHRHGPFFAILAPSPEDFARSGDIVRTLGIQRSPWTVTHHGLEVPLVADNATGGVELPGFTVPPSGTGYLANSAPGATEDTVAISFPLACKREKDPASAPCKLIITRLGCGHWGRMITDNLVGRRPMMWKPTTVRFDRQKVYIHTDECEDLVHSVPLLGSRFL